MNEKKEQEATFQVQSHYQSVHPLWSMYAPDCMILHSNSYPLP